MIYDRLELAVTLQTSEVTLMNRDGLISAESFIESLLAKVRNSK